MSYLTAHRAAGTLPGCSAEPSAARTVSLPAEAAVTSPGYVTAVINRTPHLPTLTPTMVGHLVSPPPPGHGQQLPVLYFLTQLALSSFRNGGQFSHNDIIVREVAAGLGCHPVAGDRSVSLH